MGRLACRIMTAHPRRHTVPRGCPMRRACALFTVAATAVTLAGTAAQETYPSRPIRLVVASSAGGVHDVIGRLWADRVKTTLGAVIIDNRGGAGGSVGVSEVARA